MESNLLKLKFSEFKIKCECISDIELPAYPGTSLRGAFGLSLKEVSCLYRKKCRDYCKRPYLCAYGYVFETPIPEDTEIMRKYRHAPHPFVLIPPLENKKIYKGGEKIEFGLVLIGKAINFLPYFIFAIMKMGERGIGKGRKEGKGKFIVDKVYYRERVIYDKRTDAINIEDYGETGEKFIDLKYKNIKHIDIEFLTPVRIVYAKKVAYEPDFHIIIRNLLRRMGLLLYFHCSEKPNIDFIKSMIKRAEKVSLIEKDLTKVKVDRYSMRQKKRIKYDGIVGRLRYKGDLIPFLPYLKTGEKIHIGKNTSFGFGKYKIEIY